jgi:hypothetical protein
MFYECMIAEKPYWERIERERAYRATKEAGGETAKENGENGNGETENYASFTYFPPLCIMYHVGRKSSDSEAGI